MKLVKSKEELEKLIVVREVFGTTLKSTLGSTGFNTDMW